MKLKKTLCLYTAQFPYGLGEQFIEKEINYLAKAFEKVFIFPINIEGNLRSIPSNVEIIVFSFNLYTTNKGLWSIKKWFFKCLPDLLKEKKKKKAISYLLQVGYQANVLYTYLKKNNLLNNTVHYSYWFDNWSLILSIIKSKRQLHAYISRAHGFDLYEYRRKNNCIPYRKFQLQQISKLYLISKDGLEYMQTKYPEFKDKYELSYLGIENDHPFEPIKNSNPQYLVVSCSRMVDIKRVDLIVKSLALIKNIQIKWVHFGGGELFDKIKKIAVTAIPENIKWELKGMVSNTEVLQFFKKNQVDLFINLSSTEGLPVSIMEALSYGVPILATNVGGTKEIVNNTTGILLPPGFTIEEASSQIKRILNNSRNIEYRISIYNYWNIHFNAKLNYPAFCNKIIYK